MSTFSDDLIAELLPFIQRRDVRVVENWEQFTKIIESNFPFLGSKIDWRRVPLSVSRKQVEGSTAGQSKSFMHEMIETSGLPSEEEVAIVGDSAIDFALVTQVKQLDAFIEHVFEIPQHTYLAAVDGNWCMVFTMEGDMCFGFAPN